MSTRADGIRVACDTCSSEFRVKTKALGRKVKCPKCGQETLVREAITPSSVEPESAATETSEDGLLEFLQNVNPSSQAALPPLPPQVHLSNTEYTITKPRAPEIKSRKYRALEVVRSLLYIFAGLVFAGWTFYSLITFLALVGVFASAPQTAEWPADVPRGTSVFDPGLTNEQRESIIEFDQANRVQPMANSMVAGLGIVTWIFVTIPSFLSIVLFCSYAELIKVAVDIQENTQRTAHYAFYHR